MKNNLEKYIEVLEARLKKINSRLYIGICNNVVFVTSDSYKSQLSIANVLRDDVEIFRYSSVSRDEWNSIPHELVLKTVKEWQEEFKNKSELVDYVKLIKKWAVDKDLHIGDGHGQFIKLGEEFGELARGFIRDDIDEIKDSLGDMFVVMTILAQQLDLDIVDCIAHAYNIIKDRKGKMVNGIFVKSSDLSRD